MALTDFQMQIISLAVAFFLGIGIIAFRQRSFLFKFFRVAGSFGKLVMIRVRASPENYFIVGSISPTNNLIFKSKDENTGKKVELKIALPDRYKESIIKVEGMPDRIIKTPTNPIYRVMNINWIDIDGEKSCILMPDTSTESGFDPHKFSDLLIRALYRPSLVEDKQKIIIILLVILLLFILGIGFFIFKMNQSISNLSGQLSSIQSMLTVVNP